MDLREPAHEPRGTHRPPAWPGGPRRHTPWGLAGLDRNSARVCAPPLVGTRVAPASRTWSGPPHHLRASTVNMNYVEKDVKNRGLSSNAEDET